MAEEAVKYDPFKTPDISLEGWWLVDALDGKRWLGRLAVAADQFDMAPLLYTPPLLEDEIVLHPALEVCPNRALALMMVPTPTVNPQTLKQEMGMTPQAMPLSANNFGLVFDAQKNGLPPVRVRRCSMLRLSDWGREVRGMLRSGIAKSLEAAKLEAPDTIVQQSREKVR